MQFWEKRVHSEGFDTEGCNIENKIVLGTTPYDARLPRSEGIPYIFKACEKKSLDRICPRLHLLHLIFQYLKYILSKKIVFFLILQKCYPLT